jgi:hypothetical protein
MGTESASMLSDGHKKSRIPVETGFFSRTVAFLAQARF